MSLILRHIPNILTAIRIFLAPLVGYLVLNHYDLAALLVFVIAGASDALDGFLARRFGLISRFGEYLDPAADKLLMLSSFITLTMMDAVPLWLTALVIGRDIAIVIGVGIARLFSLPVKIEPLAVGKASTVVQVGYVALILLLLTFDVGMPVLAESAGIIAAAFTLMSWFSYGQLLLRAFVLGRRPA
ncbi:MAG: CDP-alcohol phosphatidyltransferase family protein [Proteobacteria bacterium]|nr:CDP-alcohol phosphatidyltransferase family protein [Pseudomonadota bacterium]